MVIKDTTKSQIEYFLRSGMDIRTIARMVKRSPEYVRSIRSKLKAASGKRARNVG